MIKILSILTSLLLVSLELSATTYYVSPSATGSGNGTQSNPYTITQAKTAIIAGDTVIVGAGTYDFTTTSINFSIDGTSSNPIVWIGTNKNWSDEDCTSDSSTMFYGNSIANTRITISGDYNEFHNIIFKQAQPRTLITVSGTHVTMDSCSLKYPSDIANSTNHLMYVHGANFTLRYSHLYHSPRTAVWVQWSSTAPDNALIENCTFIGHTSHPCFQIMPYTNVVSPNAIQGVIIRNNTFIDNSFSDLFYLRHNSNFKIYNNLIIRSGRISFPMHPVEPYDTTGGGVIAYNTSVSNSTNYYFIYDAATQGLTIKNNIVYSTTAFYSGLVYRFQCEAYGSPPYPPILRHAIDYNMYYNAAYTSAFLTTARVYWANTSCVISNWTFSTWLSNYPAIDANSTFTVAPAFTNAGSDDYTLSTNSTGTPISGITTDFFGNPRDSNNPTIGAFEFYNSVDIIPPKVISATLINSSVLRITFSEPLALAGAENPSNYFINNGVTVNSVSCSGNQATLQTTPHTTGSYTVTVNNVTDIAGNLISPTNNTAQYNVQLDVTPPELVSASLIDSVILSLTFSEVLDPSTGQNINNYSISNGISVLGASLSGTQVRLSTSVHIPGNYTITVNNVKDVAGNIISSSANSVAYEMVENPQQGLVELPILSTTASVIPEPLHSPDKTIDGLGYDDGDPDSRWAGDTMPEWLVYDFGNVRILNTTRLSFYNWDEGRIYNYSLLVSTDSLNWSDVRTDIQSSSQEWSIQEIGTIEARYLKIIFISNNQNTWAGLWEANFLGMADTTPPEVSSASLTNSTTLVINFSEPMDPASSVVLSNYVIGSGVTINSASLSTDGKRVTLNTSQHTANQSYTVVVSNVKDLAGNIISSRNSAQYSFIENTVGNLQADVKVFLQGPFQSDIMMTALSENGLIPSSQPYNTAPWNYSGNESLPAGQAGLSVDWVLVELRSSLNPSQVVAKRAGLLRNDGRIMEPDGTLGVTFNNLLYGSYYIAVYHRNHLAVMTSAPVLFSPNNSLYDFTNSLISAYGQNALAEMTAGVFGMVAGDGNSDGGITIADQYDVWLPQNGSFGYLKGDFNLDSGVTIHDVNLYWNLNNGRMTQVP